MHQALLGLTAMVVGALASRDTAPFPITKNATNPAGPSGTTRPTAPFPVSGNKTRSAGPSGTSYIPTVTKPPVAASDVNMGLFGLKALPEACTASAAPFQTGFWVESTQMNIEDDGGWWGTAAPVEWTFSTNTSNVVFTMPDFPGANGQDGNTVVPNVTARSSGNSFTISMNGDDAGASILNFFVFDNEGTDNVSLWNSTKLSSAIPERNITFFLNITGDYPCSHPVGNTSCPAGTIERTQDQWSAYGVDQWFQNWVTSNNHTFQNTPMIQKFVEDFGVGSGKTCTIQNQCQLIDNCNSLPNSGKDDNSAQIYLVLVAFQNLSDMLNKVWADLNIGQTDTMTQIAQIAMQYHHINYTTTAANHPPWALASGAMGVLGAVFGMIPETPLLPAGIGGVLGLASAIAGVVNGRVIGQASTSMPDSQYATNQANISQFLGDYVGALRTSIEDSYTQIFDHAANITEMLQGGAIVNRTGLNIDCNNCVPQQEGWTEQFLSLKMINQIWWQQNAFITFMPYGNITQVDTFKTTTFTESDCASNFLNTDDDKALTVCHTDDYGWSGFLGPGMARLNWYNPQDPNTVEVSSSGYGRLNMSNGPPGFNTTSVVLNTTGTSTYNLKAVDVVQSSLRGWIQGGFNFDGVQNQASMAINSPPGSAAVGDALSTMFNMNATSAGMFSIPVCVLTDLNRWPTFWSTKDRIGGDYYSPCQGSKDKNGAKFEDFVSPDLRAILTTQFVVDGSTQPVGPGQILGGEPSG